MRSTERQYVNIPLDASLMEQMDPKLLPVGQSAAIQNANLNTMGSLTKRNGTDAIPTTFSDKRSIYAHNSELLVNSDGYLWSYQENQGTFENKGSLIPCDVSYRQLSLENATVIGINNLLVYADMAEANGYQFIIHDDDRVGPCLRIIEKVTGNLIFEQYATGLPTNYLGIQAIGNIVYLIFNDPVTSLIFDIKAIDATQLATFTGINSYDIQLPQAITVSFHLPRVIDCCVTSDGYLAIAATVQDVSSGTVNKLAVFKYNSTVGLLPTQPLINDYVNNSDQVLQNLGIAAGTSGDVYVIWKQQGGTIKTVGYNANLSLKYGAATLAVDHSASNFAGISYSATDIMWLYDGYASLTNSVSPTVNYALVGKTAGAVDSGPIPWYTGARLFTRPWAYKNTFAFGVHYTTASTVGSVSSSADFRESFQPTYFMVDLNRNIHARILPGEGPFESWIIDNGNLIKPRNVVVDGYQVYTMASRSNESYVYATGFGSDPSPLPVVLKLDYSGKTTYAKHGTNAYFGGCGTVKEYDGKNVYENNYHLYPEFTSHDFTGLATFPAGTYSWIMVWKYLDANGQLSLSNTSPPITLTLNGSQAPKFYYLLPQLTEKPQRNIIVALYMTAANGSIYYLNHTGPGLQSGLGTTDQEGSLQPGNINTSAETLYTTGNVANNICPPAARAVLESQNRLFAIDSRGMISFTQPYEDRFGCEFGDVLNFPTQATGDGYYMMGEMEGRVIVVSPTQVMQFYGQGPDFTGANSDYVPTVFAKNISPTSPALITTDQGMFYASGSGLVNITRDINVTYISKPVISTAENFITSEVFDVFNRELRFTTVNNVMLSFNYFTNKWQTFTGLNVIDSCIWQGNHTLLSQDGYVLVGDPDSFLDYEAKPIQLQIETPWIRLNGLRGYSICWNAAVTGTWRSPHYLNYQVYANDNRMTPIKSGFFDLTSGYSVNDPIFVNLCLNTYHTGIKFVLWDSNQSGTFESLKLNTIELEVGVKKGVRKLPATLTQ